MGKTLILDTQNFSHRAKAGFNNDGNLFLFKFIRNLRALVGEIKPTSLVMIKEGSPKHRYELFKDYKANRKIKENDPKLQEKWADLMQFKQQTDEAIAFCLKDLDVTVLRHPNLEADDVIANYALFLVDRGEEVVVASNDKDFMALIFSEPRIQVYNLGTKKFFECPAYNPVTFKALNGDKSDNIPGIKGWGKKKAEQAAWNYGKAGEKDMTTVLSGTDLETFQRNVKLVEFAEMKPEDWCRVESMRGHWDPAALMIDFHTYGFTTLTSDKTLEKYYDTFGNMKPARMPTEVR